MYIQKYLYPATYPAISLTSAIEALLEEAEPWTEPMTTDNYWAELSTAKADAETYKADEDLSKQKEVLDALQTALDHVNAVGDITYLRPTITLANAEGIDTSDAEAFVVNGTTSGVPVLNALRQARQLKANGEHAAFTGEAPAVGSTYYLYNVGQKLFISAALNGGHEMSLNFVGEALTLEANSDGYQLKGTIHTDQYMGHQWASQGFFDGATGTDATRWYFIPVEGKTNVYNISKANNTNNGNLLGYPVPAVPTYALNALDATNDWAMQVLHNRSGVNDANNQWVFVTKAERDALLETATETNGIDATYYINDAKFDRNHSLQSSWTFDGVTTPSGEWEDMTCDVWNGGNVKVYQVLTGLKPGLYKVSVQGLYRHLVHNSEYPLAIAGTNKTDGAVVYGTNGDGETKTAYIKTLADMVDNIPGMGQPVEVDGVKHWIPSDSRYYKFGLTYNGYQYWFHNGLNWSTTDDFIKVGEDGTLTIGVEKISTDENEYMLLDNFRLTYYGPAPMEVALTNGFATFSAVSNFKITTDGVKAYQATTQDGGQIVMAPLAGVIPANTGVVLFGEGQTSVTLTPTSDTAIDDLTGNMLRPHIERGPVASESDGCKNYLLTKDPKNAENCIFRPSSGSGDLAANRAYLAVPKGNGAKENFFISFSDDPITGIKTTMNEELRMKDSSAVYDLQGRKVADNPSSLISRPSYKKGVYIVNGKKVVIK